MAQPIRSPHLLPNFFRPWRTPSSNRNLAAPAASMDCLENRKPWVFNATWATCQGGFSQLTFRSGSVIWMAGDHRILLNYSNSPTCLKLAEIRPPIGIISTTDHHSSDVTTWGHFLNFIQIYIYYPYHILWLVIFFHDSPSIFPWISQENPHLSINTSINDTSLIIDISINMMKDISRDIMDIMDVYDSSFWWSPWISLVRGRKGFWRLKNHHCFVSRNGFGEPI